MPWHDFKKISIETSWYALGITNRLWQESTGHRHGSIVGFVCLNWTKDGKIAELPVIWDTKTIKRYDSAVFNQLRPEIHEVPQNAAICRTISSVVSNNSAQSEKAYSK